MLYSKNNAAKEWIFRDIQKRFQGKVIQILDIGCGEGYKWKQFIVDNPSFYYLGIDTDTRAIEKSKPSEFDRMKFNVADGQFFNSNPVDVVMTF